MKIEIPREIGTLYQEEGLDAQKTVILVPKRFQGYHEEKGLVRFVEYLAENYGLRLLITDGSPKGKINTEVIDLLRGASRIFGSLLLPNMEEAELKKNEKDVAVRTAEEQLKKGQITALEYIALTTELAFEFGGLEDMAMYAESARLFGHLQHFNESLCGDIRVIQSGLFDKHRAKMRNDAQRDPEICEFDEEMDMLRRIIKIGATASYVAHFKRNRYKFSSEHIRSKLIEYGLKTHDATLAKIDKILPLAEKFYEVAAQRASSYAQTIEEVLVSGEHRLALATVSAFCIDGIVDSFKERGVHYCTVSPKKISSQSVPEQSYEERERIYKKNLCAGIQTLSKTGVLRDDEMAAFRELFPYYAREFIVREPISRGAYKHVVQLSNPKTGEFVALKIIDLLNLSEKARTYLRQMRAEDPEEVFKKEAGRMEELKKKGVSHVSMLLGSGVSNGLCMFVEEYSERTLMDYVVRNHPLVQDTILSLAMQLAEGFAEVHANGTYHGDGHPDNILFNNSIIRITDFDLCSSLPDEQAEIYRIPHSEIRAPELFTGTNPNKCSDVWAYCVDVLFMKNGVMPFRTTFKGAPAEWMLLLNEEKEVFRNGVRANIAANYRSVVESIDYCFSGSLARVLKQGLEMDPDRRIKDAVVLYEMLKS